MASSILGTELKTLGEGIIHGIGLLLSQKEKLLNVATVKKDRDRLRASS